MENGAKAGIALIGVAAVVFLGSFALGQKPPDAACELSAGGLGLVGSTVKQGRSAAALAVGTGGLIAANEACKYFLKQLDEDPEKKQPVTVTTDTGDIKDTISRSDLTADPPPPPAPPAPSEAERRARVQHFLDCAISYDTAVLRQWCYERKLQPIVNE